MPRNLLLFRARSKISLKVRIRFALAPFWKCSRWLWLRPACHNIIQHARCQSGGIFLAAGQPVAYSNAGIWSFPRRQSQCNFALPVQRPPIPASDLHDWCNAVLPSNFLRILRNTLTFRSRRRLEKMSSRLGEVTGLGRHTPKGLNYQALFESWPEGSVTLNSSHFLGWSRQQRITESGAWGTGFLQCSSGTMFVRRFSKGLDRLKSTTPGLDATTRIRVASCAPDPDA